MRSVWVPVLAALVLCPSLVDAQAIFPEPKNDIEARNLETLRQWGDEVWGSGRLDLVPDLVAPEYVRHGADDTRVVTPESYAREIETARGGGIRFVLNAVSLDGDLIWTRWSVSATGPDGEPAAGRGIQIYRLENGKLAETWVMNQPGEHWPDNP